MSRPEACRRSHDGPSPASSAVAADRADHDATRRTGPGGTGPRRWRRLTASALALALLASACDTDGTDEDVGPEDAAEAPDDDATTPDVDDDADGEVDEADDPDAGDGAWETGEVGAFAEDADCFGIEVVDLDDDEVTCGSVEVPLDHADPDRGRIELAVAVLAADASGDDADDDGDDDAAGDDADVDATGDDADDDGSDGAGRLPMMLLGGGPGEIVIETALTEPLVRQQFRSDRDVILLDQRGVGSSEPALDCPDLDDDEVQDPGSDVDEFLDALRDCAAGLRDDGVDLEAFNHIANALDVDGVRQALGHDEIDVRGGSYGAHLALHAASLNPDGIRSLVLSSPVDPSVNYLEGSAGGFQDALDRVAEACDDAPACAQEVGDVEAAVQEVVDRLEQDPEEVTVQPPGGEEVSATFTPATFVNGLFWLFYLPEGGFALPAIVEQARGGDLSTLAEIRALIDQQLEEGISVGLHYSMVCTGEGASFDVEAARDELRTDVLDEHWFSDGGLGAEHTAAVCDAWGVEQVYDPADFTFPEEVPALIVTGELDHVTRPAFGTAVADELDTAHLVEVPGVGHAPLESLEAFVPGCGQGIVEDFLADPQAAPDDTCVGQVPPLSPLGELPTMP
jgi:pimeloyl-ACP methyl ester carboxylesterase